MLAVNASRLFCGGGFGEVLIVSRAAPVVLADLRVVAGGVVVKCVGLEIRYSGYLRFHGSSSFASVQGGPLNSVDGRPSFGDTGMMILVVNVCREIL